MDITPQMKESIYNEEKARRERSEDSSSVEALLLLNVLLAAVLSLIFVVSKQSDKSRISIDALRKAYDGLAPEDEEAEA